MKSPPIGKIVSWLVVVFLAYAIFASPDAAADIVGSIWDVAYQSIKNIAIFFDQLLN